MKKIILSILVLSLTGCYNLQSQVRYDLTGPQSIDLNHSYEKNEVESFPESDMVPMKLKK